MKKNRKNVIIRHADPLGRLGVPPDAMHGALNNVLIVARLTDSQLCAVLDAVRPRSGSLPQ